ncbi:MAG: hypothetical protein NC117_06355 [Pseudoflavonifractor sp.]|nr:hypothetical protein [Pseudoflavonifractor sp.]
MLMQLFWSCYIEPYGEDYLNQQIEFINDQTTTELVKCCLDNIPDFINAEVDNFYEFMDNIASVDFNLPEFHKEIPVFGINNVHHFIRDYLATPHIDKWPSLLAFWVYRMNYYDEGNENDNDDILCMQNAIRNLHTRLSKSKLVPDPKSFIKLGEANANRILRSEGLMTFGLVPKADNNPPLSGRFLLSPKYLRFMDGFVWLYHPKFPGGADGHLPLKYELKESRKVFSNINHYLLKKLPPIQVEAHNGCIVKVLTPFSLTECIELIEHKSESPNVSKEKAKPTVQRKDFAKSEARTLIKEFKSRYLNYLCASQLDDFKVVCCIEQRTTESGTSATEYSFIFTLKSTPRKTLLIFENVNNSRSTYAVSVDTSSYEDCVDIVFAYFASDILNKRQKMASGELRINHSGIREMKRIFHKDYLTWCDAIKSLKYF